MIPKHSILQSWPRLLQNWPQRLSQSIILLTMLFSLILLGGCASDNKKDNTELSAQELYTEAKRELKAGDFELAIEHLETLESRFPFGKFAPQAQLETAYAYYKYEEYDSTIASANRFIKLHPTHDKVDYAYYLRGLASFHKKDAPLDAIAPQDPTFRDPSTARESFNYFSELVKKFPKSKYAPDAIKRMRFQRNTLAAHELHVADFYMKRRAFVAAVNRSKYVIEKYPQTPSIPEALIIMAKAYEALDMADLAMDTKMILKKNFPKYESVPRDMESN